MRRKILTAAAGGLVAATAAVVALGSGGASAGGWEAEATLRDAAGNRLGSVRFEGDDGATSVRLKLQRVPAGAALDAFHGFHIHANNDAANGTGCVADPAGAPATWFVSADGHWTKDPAGHGLHTGDLPSVLVLADGTADIRFRTGRFDPGELTGRAVVLHAGADNFGNVPVGTAANQYTPNSDGATGLTGRTGNAGDRIACGVIGEERD